MSNLATKRILSDLKIVKTNCLDKHNIFVSTNEENVFNVKAMIIGPDDTPYEGGFYFLDIVFPKNYPLDPPKATFMTLNQEVRFNPNLYKNGKVCVSILNTWAGPGWTTACTLSGILLSIQSLLNEKPIHNEPGYEKENGDKCRIYNEMVEYYNLKVATIQMIRDTPKGFEEFRDIMIKHLITNYEKYRKFLQKRMFLDGEVRNFRIYGMSTKLNYKKVEDDLTLLNSEFEGLYKQ
jgi:ubiquitin-conjugating enzyme E2 Z